MTDKHVLSHHCWAEGPCDHDECPRTCMKPFLHSGDCEWERDDQIALGFTEWAKRLITEECA